MNDATIDLNINEENQISFKLDIDGSTTEMNVKPNVRFCLCDDDNDMSFTFGMKKDQDNDEVFVVLPPMNAFLPNYEGKTYTGKLEVIIGSRYFVPSVFDVVFKKPLTVEVKTVRKSNLPESLNNIREPKVSAKVVSGNSERKAKVVNEEKNTPQKPEQKLSPTQKQKLTREQYLNMKKIGKLYGQASNLRNRYEESK